MQRAEAAHLDIWKIGVGHQAGFARKPRVFLFDEPLSNLDAKLRAAIRNESIHQKTIGLDDRYLNNWRGGPPLGNVQLVGNISGAIPK